MSQRCIPARKTAQLRRDTATAAPGHGPAMSITTVNSPSVTSLNAVRTADRGTLVRYDHRPHARLRLFCFPWSGASASAFRPWASAMPDEIELVGIQLPGRGGRRDEAPSARLAPLARQVTRALATELDESPGPFAVFGHSLGALLAHEVARRLEGRGRHPQLVVLSGSRAPHRPPRVRLHRLGDADLLAALQRFGAMSGRTNDAGFLSYFLPLVRTDLTAVETHQPAVSGPLGSPLSAWAGADDWYAPPDEVRRWRSLAGRAYRDRTFSGGHFFTGDLSRTMTALLDDLAWSRRQATVYRVRPLTAADRGLADDVSVSPPEAGVVTVTVRLDAQPADRPALRSIPTAA
jgi:surfactin synthase thioesterase subunit